MSDSPADDVKPAILLVGADPAYLDLLADVLNLDGFTILRAAMGDEEAELALVPRAAAIVLDCTLSATLTVDAWEHLSETPKMRRIPLVLLTERQPKTLDVFRANGAIVHCVMKSADAKEVAANIREVLDGPAPASGVETLHHAGNNKNPSAYRVHRAGREIRLSPIEFRLLKHFMENPD